MDAFPANDPAESAASLTACQIQHTHTHRYVLSDFFFTLYIRKADRDRAYRKRMSKQMRLQFKPRSWMSRASQKRSFWNARFRRDTCLGFEWGNRSAVQPPFPSFQRNASAWSLAVNVCVIGMTADINTVEQMWKMTVNRDRDVEVCACVWGCQIRWPAVIV